MVVVPGKPSALIHEIRMEQTENWRLFKFSDKLQHRMEQLLEHKKADLLTPEDMLELDAISELDRIFTHINAMIVADDANH